MLIFCLCFLVKKDSNRSEIIFCPFLKECFKEAINQKNLKDLKKEIEGMIINERLWRVVNELSINGNNYTDAYLSLTENLQRHLSKIALNAYHEKFMKIQLTNMRKWTEITDKLR